MPVVDILGRPIAGAGTRGQRLATLAWIRAFPRRTRRRLFEVAHGYSPDFDNPGSFSEKLQVRLLNAPDPDYLSYADKVRAPDYARARVGSGLDYAQRFGVYNRITPADLDALPKAFVLKLSFGSGVNSVVPDKAEVDLEALARRFNRARTRTRNARLERGRSCAILAEELVRSPAGDAPTDYKFHCFNKREPGGFDWVLKVDQRELGRRGQRLFDSDLRVLPFRFGNLPAPAGELELPTELETMVEIARSLSSEFDYMRVDLMEAHGRVVFGELTPFHRGGWTPVSPRERDFRLGEMWTLRD